MLVEVVMKCRSSQCTFTKEGTWTKRMGPNVVVPGWEEGLYMGEGEYVCAYCGEDGEES